MSRTTENDIVDHTLHGGVAIRGALSRGESPVTFQEDLSDSAWSHRKLSFAAVSDPKLEAEIDERHNWPRADFSKINVGRDSNLDSRLDSVPASKMENTNAHSTILATENLFHNADRNYFPWRSEGVSQVQNNWSEANSSTKVAHMQHRILSKYPSNFKRFCSVDSSSNPTSPPSPRPSPGPGLGPHGSPVQVSELHETPRAVHVQPSPVQYLEPPQTTQRGILFPVHSAQSLQRRPQSRSPKRRESGNDILEKIKRLRVEVWGLRSQVSDKRTALREMEREKAVADDKFMTFIRANGIETISGIQDKSKKQEALTKLFDDCETLRNEYGPLEDDCNLLEGHLNNREYEMQKLEAVVGEWWSQTENLQQEHVSPRYSSSSSSPIDRRSLSSLSYHPLIVEYLSKIGERDICQERLEWHFEEKLTLEEERERRGRVNLKLAEADEKWLDNYSETEATMIKQLEEAEREVERLRIQCHSLGLVDEEGDPLDFERLERHTFAADELEVGIETSGFVKFPLLLSNPRTKEMQLSDPHPPPDNSRKHPHERQDPSDRVNEWLLQKLRSSPLDVNLLARTSESLFGPILDMEKWQSDVLKFWYHDGSREAAMAG